MIKIPRTDSQIATYQRLRSCHTKAKAIARATQMGRARKEIEKRINVSRNKWAIKHQDRSGSTRTLRQTTWQTMGHAGDEIHLAGLLRGNSRVTEERKRFRRMVDCQAWIR